MTMRCFLSARCVCSIFARWGYKNTNARNDMTMRCLFSERCVCIFVVYLQDGVTKIQTHAMTWRCVALFSDWCVCILIKYLQDGFTKIQTHAIRARNTRFRCLFFGQKTGFRARMNGIKSGIPCSARNDMTMRCFVFGLMRLYRGKIFARWVCKNTNARDITLRCLLLERCVCIFVVYLQDGVQWSEQKLRDFGPPYLRSDELHTWVLKSG